jgi:hypothetical protein
MRKVLNSTTQIGGRSRHLGVKPDIASAALCRRSGMVGRSKRNLMVQLKPLVEELLVEERDRQKAQFEKQGAKVVRWGYTVRKYWQTPWGVLKRVPMPRLRRDGKEIGLMKKYHPPSDASLDRADRWQNKFLEYTAIWAFFLTRESCISRAQTKRP